MKRVTVQLKRATATEWTTNNPTLSAGEVGVEIPTNPSSPPKIKIGNGANSWTDLPYVTSGDGAGVSMSPTPPTGASQGDLWYETDTGSFFVYHSAVWVEVGSSSAGSQNISDLFDVDTAGVSDGDMLLYDGPLSEWQPAAPAYVERAGDTMTGALTLPNSDPTDSNHAARKLYVDTVAAGAALGLRDIAYFTTVGTATFTKATYPWLRAVRVCVQAGGGGGAGVSADAADRGSSGGGGGGYAESFIDASSLGSSVTITVGAGGAGGAAGANDGAQGGSSSFGTLVAASGGVGGQREQSGNVSGGRGGVGTAGDLTLRGGGGGPNTPFGRAGAAGGSSHLGGGAPGVTRYGATLGAPGLAGEVYGGGGGGAATISTAQAGGAGAQGIVIVELYA